MKYTVEEHDDVALAVDSRGFLIGEWYYKRSYAEDIISGPSGEYFPCTSIETFKARFDEKKE
jgi:hypothetical protein